MWCFIEMFNRNHEKHYQSGERGVKTWCSCPALMFCSCPPTSSSSQEQTSRTCFNSNIPGLQCLSMCETYFISVVQADKMKRLLRKDLEDRNLKDITKKCFLFPICHFKFWNIIVSYEFCQALSRAVISAAARSYQC